MLAWSLAFWSTVTNDYQPRAPHPRRNAEAPADHPGWATSCNRSGNPGEGLRFNEVRHLQTVDFSRNPHGREFGRYGVVQVRYGKAKKGSPPKRRSVLTVFDWTPEVIADWLAHGQPYMDDGHRPVPQRARARWSPNTPCSRRFRRYCDDDLQLSGGLDLHSLRRSYATHLIEDGWDAKFVQDQLGHEHASTTSLYTCVSSDFRTRTLRRALDATINEALSFDGEESS